MDMIPVGIGILLLGILMIWYFIEDSSSFFLAALSSVCGGLFVGDLLAVYLIAFEKPFILFESELLEKIIFLII